MCRDRADRSVHIARIAVHRVGTGAQVVMRSVSYGGWEGELDIDLGTTPGSGARLFDAYIYMIKSAWFVHYAELGAREPLNSYITMSNDDTLQWTDVLPIIRDKLVTHKQQVYVLPNDADFVILYGRTDLFERDNRTWPRTWEELIEVRLWRPHHI